MAIVDIFVVPLADSIGIHKDLVKTVLCMLLSYPLSSVLKRLPDNTKFYKEVFSISISLFYLVGIFDLWHGLFTILLSSGFTYIISSKLRTLPLMPWINFLFVLLHLFSNHLSVQMRDDFDVNVIDVTYPQMVLCMKLSAFGFNVYDGTLAEEALSDFQKNRRIVDHPPLLDFLAYVFFFPSLMTGPSFDYMEFSRFLDLTMFDSLSKVIKGKRKRVIPKSGDVAAWKLVQGIIWWALWISMSSKFNPTDCLKPEFMNYTFVTRVVYIWWCSAVYRWKYYGAWNISEGACILSGLGFNGVNSKGQLKWDRVKNINIYDVELGQNIHDLLEAWNMNTNKWLKYYVYLRLTPKGKKPGFRSTLATFFTSAFWHGSRPGYYMTFILGAFFQSIGRLYRKNLRPIFLEADGVTPVSYKWLYDIVSVIVTALSVGSATMPFILLDIRPSLQLWSTVYYWIHIGVILNLFLFKGPFSKQFLKWLRSFHPAPLTPSQKIKLDSEKLRQIKEELARLSSVQPTLGVPQPDIDKFDEDVREALDELELLKQELVRDLSKVRRNSNAEKKG